MFSTARGLETLGVTERRKAWAHQFTLPAWTEHWVPRPARGEANSGCRRQGVMCVCEWVGVSACPRGPVPGGWARPGSLEPGRVPGAGQEAPPL